MTHSPSVDYELLDAVFGGHVAAFKHLPEFKHCNYVPGEGGPDLPRVMLIGEAPGTMENVHKRPFVGPAGRALRQLMNIANLRTQQRSQYFDDGIGNHGTVEQQPNAWLTNVLKYRPMRDRTPTEDEIFTARPMLRMEWEAIGKPRIIVCVGAVALHAVMGKRIGILNSAGKCHKVRNSAGIDMAVWPMVHPAWVLRSKSEQLGDLIERDWENLGEWLNRNGYFAFAGSG